MCPGGSRPRGRPAESPRPGPPAVGPVARPVVVPDQDDRFQEEVTGYVRSPSDVLRTVVFALATVLVVLLAVWTRTALPSLEADLVERLSFLTATVERILVGALTVLMLASLTAAWVTPLLLSRYRLLG